MAGISSLIDLTLLIPKLLPLPLGLTKHGSFSCLMIFEESIVFPFFSFIDLAHGISKFLKNSLQAPLSKLNAKLFS